MACVLVVLLIFGLTHVDQGLRAFASDASIHTIDEPEEIGLNESGQHEEGIQEAGDEMQVATLPHQEDSDVQPDLSEGDSDENDESTPRQLQDATDSIGENDASAFRDDSLGTRSDEAEASENLRAVLWPLVPQRHITPFSNDTFSFRLQAPSKMNPMGLVIGIRPAGSADEWLILNEVSPTQSGHTAWGADLRKDTDHEFVPQYSQGYRQKSVS